MLNPGAILLIIAVALRALFWYSQENYFSLAAVILCTYSLLFFSMLLLEKKLRKPATKLYWGVQALYLVLQAGLIMTLLILPPLNDFCALLFVPLSLQAVQFYRRSTGTHWITAFTFCMAGILLRGGEKFPSGLLMALIFGGTCLLAGNYSHLIQTAQEVRHDNQRTLIELQTAHRQLQSYAQQRQELAAEEERHRLARELHDSITQNIFSMNLTAQSARLLLERETSQVEALLEQLQRLVRSVTDEIQMVATQFQTAPDSVDNLETAILKLLDDHQRYQGLRVNLETGESRDLPSTTVNNLVHIIQEALNNTTKHSGAQEATVRLHLSSNPFWLEIEDHGVGFLPQNVDNQPGHIGLSAMAERAREIGWTFSIDAQVRKGTCVRVEEVLPKGFHEKTA
jgi:signal transduction histidine kinase